MHIDWKTYTVNEFEVKWSEISHYGSCEPLVLIRQCINLEYTCGVLVASQHDMLAVHDCWIVCADYETLVSEAHLG